VTSEGAGTSFTLGAGADFFAGAATGTDDAALTTFGAGIVFNETDGTSGTFAGTPSAPSTPFFTSFAAPFFAFVCFFPPPSFGALTDFGAGIVTPTEPFPFRDPFDAFATESVPPSGLGAGIFGLGSVFPLVVETVVPFALSLIYFPARAIVRSNHQSPSLTSTRVVRSRRDARARHIRDLAEAARLGRDLSPRARPRIVDARARRVERVRASSHRSIDLARAPRSTSRARRSRAVECGAPRARARGFHGEDSFERSDLHERVYVLLVRLSFMCPARAMYKYLSDIRHAFGAGVCEVENQARRTRWTRGRARDRARRAARARSSARSSARERSSMFVVSRAVPSAASGRGIERSRRDERAGRTSGGTARRRARARASARSSEDALGELRREMYDEEETEIWMDGASGGRGALERLETRAPALRGALRAARSAIFTRLLSATAMMVFVRAGLLLPTRFFETSGVRDSVFSMTTLLSTFSGGRSALDAVASAMGLSAGSAATSEGTNWLAESLAVGGGVPWFHVGIGPYIGASIAMSVLTSLTPEFQAMRKDQTGMETIKWWTRLMTFAIAIVQSVIEARSLSAHSLVGTGFGYYLMVVPMFITGALAITWIADEITDYGLGQGSSLIITMSICGGYFSALKALIPKMLADFSLSAALPVVAFFATFMFGTVILEQGTAKVPLEYFQGPSGSAGLPKAFRLGEGDHIPFKINPTNMQPVIFAMFILSALQWLPIGFTANSFAYFVLLFILVFGGTYIDLQNTPQDISEYIMKIGARVPGVRPGAQTVDYFSRVQAGSRFFGGLLLASIATVCSLTDVWMNKSIGQSFGLTSMLIVVSTIISIKRQIQALSQMPKMEQALRAM